MLRAGQSRNPESNMAGSDHETGDGQATQAAGTPTSCNASTMVNASADSGTITKLGETLIDQNATAGTHIEAGGTRPDGLRVTGNPSITRKVRLPTIRPRPCRGLPEPSGAASREQRHAERAKSGPKTRGNNLWVVVPSNCPLRVPVRTLR
jgi:hypothetical protein